MSKNRLIHSFLALIVVRISLSACPSLADEGKLMAPLWLDGAPLTDIWCFPKEPMENTKIQAKPFIDAITPYLNDETMIEIKKLKTEKNTLSFKNIQSTGMQVTFNEKILIILLTIPSRLRKTTELGLVQKGSRPKEQDLIVEAQTFSGYLNIRGAQSFIYPSFTHEKDAREPFVGNLDLTQQYRDFVLETGTNFTEEASSPWQRTDTTVTHDFRESSIRGRVGDIHTSTEGYMAGRSLGGVSATRVYGIQPDEVTTPLSQQEILLERPSTIDIFVNSVRVSQLKLPAGKVNLRDFPLSSGLNYVELKITDDLGRTEVINLNLLYNPQLLKTGLHEFSYEFGFPSEQRNGNRDYDTKNPNFSLFHRFGLNERHTLATFGQTDLHQRMLGFESTWITPAGLTELEFAGSQLPSKKKGGAVKLRLFSLESYKDGDITPFQLTFETEYRGRYFAALGETSPRNPYSLSFDLYGSRRLSDLAALGFGGRYEFSREEQTNDLKSLRTDFSLALSNQWKASLNASRTVGNTSENQFFISINWSDLPGRHFVNLSYDHPSQVGRLSITENPRSPYGDMKLNAGIQTQPQQRQVDFDADYVGERANFGLVHATRFPQGEDANHESGARFGTALAWTPSSFTISRPITDSFAIFKTEGELKDFEIPVNSDGISAESTANWVGPAVLTNMTSYYYYPVQLDSSRLPAGYNMDKEFYYIHNRYRTGAEIILKTESFFLVTGSMYDPGNKPLELIAGEIRSVKDEKISQSFFTNRKGKFVIEGLKPGDYEIEFFDSPWQKMKLTLPENAKGTYKMPDLKVKREEGR